MIEIDREAPTFDHLSFECLVMGRDEALASWREASAQLPHNDGTLARYRKLYDLMFEAVQLVEDDFPANE